MHCILNICAHTLKFESPCCVLICLYIYTYIYCVLVNLERRGMRISYLFYVDRRAPRAEASANLILIHVVNCMYDIHAVQIVLIYRQVMKHERVRP